MRQTAAGPAALSERLRGSALAANAPPFQLQTSYKVREKLEDVNTIDQLVELLDKAQNVLVLTGAGIR